MKIRTGSLLAAAALAGAAMSAMVTGCELIASVDRSTIEGTGGAGTSTGTGGSPATTTTTTSATGTGGTGGGTSTSTGGGTCVDPVKDCPAPANECVTAICDATKSCAVSNVDKDVVLSAQTAGDCKKAVCDGNGAVTSIDDNTDTNDDAKECTTDTCVAGAPVHTPVAVKTACGAAGSATKCDAAGECVGCVDASDCGAAPACKVPTCTAGVCGTDNAADASACSDGNECTKTDACLAGACVGSNPVVCMALDQCHTTGTCATGTGICSPSLPKSNGAACNDGNACTQTDSCQAGTCTGSSPITCPQPDQCHNAGTCSPATGVCDNPAKANGASCSDGNSCTQTDTCQSGTCMGASPVVCMVLDECHDIGTCSVATGVCSNPNVPDTTPCANGTKSCLAGVCQ